MFLIFGINEGEKQIPFDQCSLCRCCGRYGHLSVWMRYTYFSLFFIPLFRWNRQYFVRMSCCGAVGELDPTLGHAVAVGEVRELRDEDLHFGGPSYAAGFHRRCRNCGYETNEDFQFCPRCGRLL